MSRSGFCLIKISVTNYHREKLIMDAYEISVQSAVMSDLEDVNSPQFFTTSNMNKLFEDVPTITQKMLSENYI